LKIKTVRHALDKVDKSEVEKLNRKLEQGHTLRKSMHHAMKGELTDKQVDAAIPRAKEAAEKAGHRYSSRRLRASLEKVDKSERKRFYKHLRDGKTPESATVASLKK
jgi:hypothetical protein